MVGKKIIRYKPVISYNVYKLVFNA